MTTVSVTKRDITQGKVDDGCGCPVARAIKRLVKKSVPIFVFGTAGVEFLMKDKVKGSKTIMRKLPQKAIDFITVFDDHCCDLGPFEFKMNIPKAALKG